MSVILKFSRKMSNGNIKSLRGVFLAANMLVTALLGLAVWIVVDFFADASVVSLVCAVGYPAVFVGLIGGVLYLMNKDLW